MKCYRSSKTKVKGFIRPKDIELLSSYWHHTDQCFFGRENADCWQSALQWEVSWRAGGLEDGHHLRNKALNHILYFENVHKDSAPWSPWLSQEGAGMKNPGKMNLWINHPLFSTNWKWISKLTLYPYFSGISTIRRVFLGFANSETKSDYILKCFKIYTKRK